MTSFNVAGLLRETPGASRLIRLRDHYVSLGPDLELAGPVDADLRLLRTNRGILVRGEARTALRRTCTRCTDPLVEDVTVPVQEEYLPTIDPETGAAVTWTGEEDARRIDEHHEIELDPVLREELLLSEPMFVLCRPDCPGLCPECGARLDDPGHRVHEPEPDPRLAGLAALLEERRE
ncbi:MAG TPA: DUF177 domain-containing protein [Candidatus Limnocylindria bacterium]|nr:DUF177 domain-containing protein [Candidatus Limnocylindria bacterium]